MIEYGRAPAGDEGSEDEPRRRRSRGRFRLTERGQNALLTYRASVAAAQAGAGARSALEQSQTQWAVSCGLGSRDALVLDELSSRPSSVIELLRALDDCGMPRADIEGGIDRLTAVGFIEPAPATVRSA